MTGNTGLLTKTDIALEQLTVAIGFYLQRKHPVAALTLAGAAEEILGKQCEAQRKEPSIRRRAEATRALYTFLWPHRMTPAGKVFVDRRNLARNQAKHNDTGAPVTFNWNREAEQMITRGIENYRALVGRETPAMRRFLARKHERGLGVVTKAKV